TVAIQGLRARMVKMIRQRGELLRRSNALLGATERLTGILDPEEVMSVAAQLSAELASPDSSGRRAQYMALDGDLVHMVAQYDETGHHVTSTFLLEDHPYLLQVVQTGEAVRSRIDPSLLGPTLRPLILEARVTSGVWVPVYCKGMLHGVLSVPGRGSARASDELFAQCKAIGHLTELALNNSFAHQDMHHAATTDPLTGLLNRRGFEQLVENRPGRADFAILVIDVDGLKVVNDTRGHYAGDVLLTRMAAAMSGVLRRGDVLARLGGDEFAAFLFEAEQGAARRMAERMLQATSRVFAWEIEGSISVGVATGGPEDDAAGVLRAADAAMYRAKRAGGKRYVVDGLPEHLTAPHRASAEPPDAEEGSTGLSA
ncbi:MAG TPA: GGDEF domain-containing protein, partial [Acidimicrobiales bacterium]|nr:GGDEF domain-containing protein [Acidimicrobiales bacterium]